MSTSTLSQPPPNSCLLPLRLFRFIIFRTDMLNTQTTLLESDYPTKGKKGRNFSYRLGAFFVMTETTLFSVCQMEES